MFRRLWPFAAPWGATECGFITSRAYRAAKARPTSARTVRDELLLPELRRVDEENYSVYGVQKMHQAMVRAGWQIGRDQAARLMKLSRGEKACGVDASRSRRSRWGSRIPACTWRNASSSPSTGSSRSGQGLDPPQR